MNCPNCGTPNQPGSPQCMRCGQPFYQQQQQQGYPPQAQAQQSYPGQQQQGMMAHGGGAAPSLQPQAHVPRPPQKSAFKDFLMFRKMITPVVIQVIFWLGLVAVLVLGLLAMSENAVQGLLMLLVGPLFLRIYCELLILFFRINDNLDEIRENTRR
jgi:hypothetical protein